MNNRTVKTVNAWWCDTCQSKEMTKDEMITHLQSIHHLDTKNLKVKKTMRMHVDGADYFSYQWDVTADTPNGEIKMTNSTCQPRKKDDPMRYC